MLLNAPSKPVQTEELPIDQNEKLSLQLAKMPEDKLTQLVKQSNQWADYTRFTSLMNGIAEEMREIPHLPSEVMNPDDTSPLIKVEFPKEGGVLTWMEKYSYPYKGYPHHEFVEKIDFIKKINRAFLSGLYHQLKHRKKFMFLTLLPSAWALKDALRAWIHVVYRFVERFRIKPIRYSTFVRELHRAFTESADEKEREFIFKIRDLLCMILEFDNAYRFRAQDVLAEMDISRLKKHTVKELLRLIEILASREKIQEIRDTWKLVERWLSLYLRFDGKLVRIIRNALSGLDIEKVKLTVEDKVFCLPRKDYSFGFVLYPQVKDRKIMELSKLDKEYGVKFDAIKTESTKEHQEEQKNGNKKENLKRLDDKYENLLKKSIDEYHQVKEKLLNPI